MPHDQRLTAKSLETETIAIYLVLSLRSSVYTGRMLPRPALRVMKKGRDVYEADGIGQGSIRFPLVTELVGVVSHAASVTFNGPGLRWIVQPRATLKEGDYASGHRLAVFRSRSADPWLSAFSFSA